MFKSVLAYIGGHLQRWYQSRYLIIVHIKTSNKSVFIFQFAQGLLDLFVRMVSEFNLG